MQQPIVLGRELTLGLGPMRFVLFLDRELLECFKVADVALQLVKWVEERAQPGDFLDVGLGTLAIVPEIGRAHARFEGG